MKTPTSNSFQFKNSDSPFTELFALLTRYEVLPEGDLGLAYTQPELKAMRQHIHNAMPILLQGKQTINNFLGVFIQENKCSRADLSTFCFFIALIDNLEEALHMLQLDVGNCN